MWPFKKVEEPVKEIIKKPDYPRFSWRIEDGVLRVKHPKSLVYMQLENICAVQVDSEEGFLRIFFGSNHSYTLGVDPEKVVPMSKIRKIQQEILKAMESK